MRPAPLLILGEIALPDVWLGHARRAERAADLESLAAGPEPPLLVAHARAITREELARWLDRDPWRFAAWVAAGPRDGEPPPGAVPVRSDDLGTPLTTLSVARERIIHLSRAQAELVKSLAHDAKSRLQGIVGVASLLEELEGQRLSPQGQDWCARLTAS